MWPWVRATKARGYRRFWGTLSGAVIGVLGGFYAALFGAAIGLLVDMLLNEFRCVRATRSYLSGKEAPLWLPLVPVLAGSLLSSLTDHSTRARPTVLVSYLRESTGITMSARLVERIVLCSSQVNWGRAESMSDAFAEALEPDARRLLIRAVWAQFQRWGDAGSVRDRMVDFALSVIQDPAFASEVLVVETDLDEDACAVLGVRRNATSDEIRAAYRKLAAQFHPDTLGQLSDEQRRASEDAFKRIASAYEKLSGQV